MGRSDQRPDVSLGWKQEEEKALAAESPTGRRWGRRLAEEGDVMQTRTFPNSGGDKELSCGEIQQNAIKDKFFIVLSCRQLGKIHRLSINELACLILFLKDAFCTGSDPGIREWSLQQPQTLRAEATKALRAGGAGAQ